MPSPVTSQLLPYLVAISSTGDARQPTMMVVSARGVAHAREVARGSDRRWGKLASSAITARRLDRLASGRAGVIVAAKTLGPSSR